MLSQIQQCTHSQYDYTKSRKSMIPPVIFGTVDLNIGDGYDEFVGNSPVSFYVLCTRLPLVIAGGA